MSISIRFLTLLIMLLVSQLAFSQSKSYQYQLDGTYSANLPGLTSPQAIRFTLLWNERNGSIEGAYGDTFFTSNSPVTGTAGNTGRVFNIQLPRRIQNVSNIAISSNIANLSGGTLPVQIMMRDVVSQTVDTANISGVVNVRDELDNPPPSACDVGFGVLSGYCGLYKGTLSEISDSGNNCNLPDYGFRFELNADARTNIYFYYSNTTIGIPSHALGALPSAPLSAELNLNTRHCGVLVGTNFTADNCQTMNLAGTFIEVGNGRNFRGRYTIIEETTGNTCTYNINVDRETGY